MANRAEIFASRPLALKLYSKKANITRGIVLALAWLLVGVTLVFSQNDPNEEKIIREVRIEGQRQVATGAILKNVRSRAGAKFDKEMISEDARQIMNMPQIATVLWRVEPVNDREVDLLFLVTETRQISNLTITGNKNIKQDKLLKELSFGVHDFLDLYQIRQGAQVLEDYYRNKGYYFVSVTLDEEALKERQEVVYTIIEGAKSRVRKIRFEGNNAFSAGKLRWKVKSKTYFPIFSKGKIDDEQIEMDCRLLEGYYRDEGYLDARVFAEKSFNRDQSRSTITYTVEEGRRYEVSDLRFEGNEIFNDDELLDRFKLRAGDIFKNKHRLAASKAVQDAYGEEGYIYSYIDPQVEYTDQEGLANLVFKIHEGDQYYLNELIIRGNYKTQDKVVRRDFDRYQFFPGNLFDTVAMERAQRRLEGSGLFDDVSVVPFGEAPYERDALVEVSEARTGLVLFGVGVDTNSGIIGQFSIEQRNFDLTKFPQSWREFFYGESFVGGGQRLRLDIEPGTRVSRGRIKFYEPYLFDQPYYLDLNAFLFRRWRESYLERRKGGYMTVGRRFDNDWEVEGTVRTEIVTVSDLDDRLNRDEDGNLTGGKYITAPQDVQDVEGDNLLTSLKVGIGRNTTDRLYRPSEGYKFQVSYEQVGALGGDFTYGDLSASATYYQTINVDLAERRTIWSTRLKGSQILGDAPVFERYYVGGIGSMRGFEYRGISPRAGIDHDPIGSEYMVLLGSEVSHPLYEEVLYGKVFCDSAYIEEGPVRVTAGIGLEIVIPQLFQMVPMHFDFGVPIVEDDEDENQLFSFNFGMTF